MLGAPKRVGQHDDLDVVSAVTNGIAGAQRSWALTVFFILHPRLRGQKRHLLTGHKHDVTAGSHFVAMLAVDASGAESIQIVRKFSAV